MLDLQLACISQPPKNGACGVVQPCSAHGHMRGSCWGLLSGCSLKSLLPACRVSAHPLSGAKGQTEGSGALENSGTPRGREPRSLNDHTEHSPAAQISLGHREEINLYCVG